ncbi:MAG TPA: response regulator [Candidatus Omnitrophota bacterium]|nr:response regulator [Candidatus Omnitrophota bacterium]
MKKKILVIDDQEDLLELTRRLLRSSGYDVLTLASGTKALDLIKKELPHLVLMDMLMPDKDGGEICQEMKSDAALHHIPVILTTGQMMDKSEYSDEQSIGADDYLMKPFEIDDLISKIENLLTASKK